MKTSVKPLLKRASDTSKISLNLRKESLKNNVISAISWVYFYDGKFLEKLDSNLDLIGLRMELMI